jgi:four helix bundle protein
MFDFEKLEVYQKIRGLNAELIPWVISKQQEHPYLCDQLKRASLSSLLNLSEGTGRMGAQDKKQFYIRSRASVFECVSILQVMLDTGVISPSKFEHFYELFEQVSKMMLGMIRNLKPGNLD